jgi:hypothetical protein
MYLLYVFHMIFRKNSNYLKNTLGWDVTPFSLVEV